MGDSFSSVFLPDLEPSEVAGAHGRVMDALLRAKIIAADQDPAAVLSPENCTSAHRPGPAFCDLHDDRRYMEMTLTLHTNGMAASVGAAWNVYEIQYIEAITCPACKAVQDDNVIGFVGANVMDLIDGKVMPHLTCPACHVASDARQWAGIEPLGLSYLGYTFWNWMPVDADGWRVDIPGLIAQAAGSRVYVGGGKL
jgi:hypothetical protein